MDAVHGNYGRPLTESSTIKALQRNARYTVPKSIGYKSNYLIRNRKKVVVELISFNVYRCVFYTVDRTGKKYDIIKNRIVLFVFQLVLQKIKCRFRLTTEYIY